MRRFPTSLLCASALLLGAVACSDDDDPSSSGEPSSTTTTTSATEEEAPKKLVVDIGKVTDSELQLAEYAIDPDGDPSTPLIVTYEIADEGWEPWIGAAKITNGPHTMLSITTVTNVVRDACLDHAPADPAVGTTVDDLATALSELAPFQVTAPPSDVTLLGYEGKHLELTVPDDIGGCENEELHSWVAPLLGDAYHGYNGPEPGLTEEFWILDVDGTRLVIETNTSPDAPADWVAERQAIFDSIQIYA